MTAQYLAASPALLSASAFSSAYQVDPGPALLLGCLSADHSRGRLRATPPRAGEAVAAVTVTTTTIMAMEATVGEMAVEEMVEEEALGAGTEVEVLRALSFSAAYQADLG